MDMGIEPVRAFFGQFFAILCGRPLWTLYWVP